MRFTSDVSDKERVLLHIIKELHATLLLAKGAMSLSFDNRGGGRDYVHFDCNNWDELQFGDLVLCGTSGIHECTIGYVEQKLRYSECLIREIGSDRTMRIENDSFHRIQGLEGAVMLEGSQYLFFKKVIQAFSEVDDWYRYQGIEFDGDVAKVTVREKFGGLCDEDEESVPFAVDIPWDEDTEVDTIYKALVDGGVGTRKFERRKKDGNVS